METICRFLKESHLKKEMEAFLSASCKVELRLNSILGEIIHPIKINFLKAMEIDGGTFGFYMETDNPITPDDIDRIKDYGFLDPLKEDKPNGYLFEEDVLHIGCD